MEVRTNSRKWATRSAGAQADYAAGAASPRRSQSEAAIAAAPNYELGVQQAITNKSFEKGLRKSGDAGWQKGVQEKGKTRYAQGVTSSEQEYQAGFEKSAAVLRSLTLAPRGPKGQNYGRVQAVGDALRAAKLAG